MDNFIVSILLSSLIGSVWFLAWRLCLAKWEKREKTVLIYWSLRGISVLYGVSLLAGIVYGIITAGSLDSALWELHSPIAVGLFRLLRVVWLAGVVFRVGDYVHKHCQHIKMLRKALPPEEKTEFVFRRIAAKMNSSDRGRVCIRFGLTSPEMCGWFTPKILLPGESYTEQELVHIVSHELLHYRHGDRWFREAAILLDCIHWFNPLLRQMLNQMQMWDEYYCDYMVCHLEWVEPASYIETLVSLARRQVIGLERQDPLAVAFCEEKNYLKQRVQKIMKFRRMRRSDIWQTIAALFVVLILGLGTALAAEIKVNQAYDAFVTESLLQK